MTRGNVRVRVAEPSDLDVLADLAESSELARGSVSGRPLPLERAQILECFSSVLANDYRTILVADDDSAGGVVGFVVICEDEIAAINPTPVLSISHLIVDPKARRRGIGRALMVAVVHLAEDRGVDHVLATASSASRDANRYLARLGFAPMMIRRVAPTTVLRRSLGIAELPDRLALRRRTRGSRATTPLRGFPSISRGA